MSLYPPEEPITSLAGLKTKATKISKVYNYKSSTFRLVSSDGVLICIPTVLLVHLPAFAKRHKKNPQTTEVVLSDPAETEAAITLYLDEQNWERPNSKKCGAASLEAALRFGAKYGASRDAFSRTLLTHLDNGCRHCTLKTLLRLGGEFGDDYLVGAVVARIVSDKDELEELSDEHVATLKPHYVARMMRALGAFAKVDKEAFHEQWDHEYEGDWRLRPESNRYHSEYDAY